MGVPVAAQFLTGGFIRIPHTPKWGRECSPYLSKFGRCQHRRREGFPGLVPRPAAGGAVHGLPDDGVPEGCAEVTAINIDGLVAGWEYIYSKVLSWLNGVPYSSTERSVFPRGM